MIMCENIIQVQSIKKAYKMGDQSIWALDGVTVDIARGDFVAVMGPSGSGKSTLMNMFGCLDSPTFGHISINGEIVSALSSDKLAEVRNRMIGFVFQQFNLLARTSAIENVMLPLFYSELDKVHWKSRALSCLHKVGLADRIEHLPSQLSGGQQQRVAIARALVNEPPIILADEPTGALDTGTGREIMELLQNLNTDGQTIVLVTHEPDVAEFANRHLIVRDGKIISDKLSDSMVDSKKSCQISVDS
jgi:putative ABC transport system ATP-binding protein